MFIGNPTTLVGKDDYHYDAKDIKTLQQKLIDDISTDIDNWIGTYGSEIMNGYTWYQYKSKLIKTINKRFGVNK